ncbi:DMT family transporter [Pseudaestuariivita atlantica]|uniref:EamA domain-containing protein n=1 Tax=Pseudaestuariivita atlantica TaxID=1317121 RepID=A0A0L1JRS9_9RHOB|nr:DMT family transporter [Pseudaestuariivita atlantica]KNG94445.1 hypothetical protein ATO11_08015 [Pseudaestuariivita atlantica]
MTAIAAVDLKPRKAALAMVGAMAIVGAIDSTVVEIAEVISVWQFFVVRAALAVPMVLVIARVTGADLRPDRWSVVILRSLLVAAAMVLYFGALGFLPIAQALAGLFTAPIFVLLITVLVQGDRIGPWRVLAVVLGFAGVLLVLQPGSEAFRPWMILPVLGGLLYALASVLTRSHCSREPTLALLAGMFLAQAVFGLAGMAVAGGGDDFISRDVTWAMGPILHWIIGQAVLSLVGVGLIIWAYQNGEPSHVAVFEYSVFIFGPLVAWLAFGQNVGPLAMLGIALIALAGSVIAVRSGQ